MTVPFPFVANAVLTAAQLNAITSLPTTAKTASATLTAAESVGYRVTMTSASATTITINTGVYAAGDTVFITNLGTGACTITAGTATVSSAGSLALPQYGSGLLVMTATGTGIWYPTAAGNTVNTVASASSIAVTGDGTYLLTGTTTVATITGGTNGMTITLQASAQASGTPVVLTYGTGANAIKLTGGRSLGIYAQVPADTTAGAGESVTLRYDGALGYWVEIARDLRTLLAYHTVVTNQTITATTEAGATAVATLAAITFDGATPFNIDFFCAYTSHSTGGATSQTAIWDSSTEVNKFTSRNQTYTSEMGVVISFPITPTAAAHTYAVKSWVSAGNVIYYAGAVGGGAGVFGPISLRISRAL